MKFSSFPARLAVLNLALAAALPAFAQSPLKAVVVTATRVAQPLTDVVADVSLIDREAIERSGATGLADLLARVPGIEISRNGGIGGTTSVFLRGADTRFTAVYIDGVRIDSQSTGGAPWEAIPLAQIDRIEVLRGPAGAIYGSDAIAGVVQIFTRKGEGAFTPYLGLGLGSDRTAKLDAGFSGAQQGFDYSFGLTRETSKGFNAKAASNPDRDGYLNRSANARLGLQLSPEQRVEANLLDSWSDSRYDSSKTTDDHNLHHLQSIGLNWQSQWSEAYSTRIGFSEGKDRYETQPSPYLTDTQVRSYLWQNEYRIGGQLLTAALERREDRLNNASTTPVLTDRSQDALALGYGLRHQAHTLQLNLRHDEDSEFGGQDTGSASYAYAFAPNWRASVSAGNAFRAPTLFQRFSIYGDPSLRPETARNFELGLNYALQSTRFGIVLYRNQIDDLINYVSGPGSCANGSGEYPGCYGNTKRARLEGLTLSGARSLAGFNLSASLDLQNPRDLDSGKLLARRSRRHATLAADTRVARWQLGAELQLSGQRYDDKDNKKALGGYGLFNLHASTEVARDFTLQARVDNLADKDYTLANGYYTPGRLFYLGLKWSPQ
jgi:vitamin B12 transporter